MGEEKKRVRFVQILSCPGVWGAGSNFGNSAYNLTTPLQWSSLYALDEDGAVWWWTGSAWAPTPMPERPEAT